ncbi:MAG: IPT/TIG domain-containing protein [Opitutales bacterium]|nr:IPT/TIG domain-containing protein [Opitutales bacterium]
MRSFSSILKARGSYLLLAIGCLFLGGCKPYLTNITPETAQRNPSNLYRFTVFFNVNQRYVVPDTLQPFLVIDGRQFPLQPEADFPGLYYYDHKLDETRTDAKYYFQIGYRQRKQGTIRDYTRKTELAFFKISDYRNMSLSVERAPMGNHVRVLGSHFTEGDHILVGDYETATTFISENVLSFQVPMVAPNKSYSIFAVHENEKHFVGNLFVDHNRFSVEPAEIALNVGEKTEITLRATAPLSNDVYINITTSIPNSIIVPEIRIAAGEESTTIPIEGAEPGKGILYLSAPGFHEISMPVEVIGEAVVEDNASED